MAGSTSTIDRDGVCGHIDADMAGEAEIGEAQARMELERQVSLETGNVTAEPVRNKRRPPSAWEASSTSTGYGRSELGMKKGRRKDSFVNE